MQTKRQHNFSKTKAQYYKGYCDTPRCKKTEKYIELRDILSNIY